MPPPVSLATDDFSEIPIFIQNFNLLSHLRRQVAWLRQAGYRNLIVIDTIRPIRRFSDTTRR